MQKENKNRLAKILLGIFSLFLSFEIYLIGFFLFENYLNTFRTSPQNIELKNALSPQLSASMPATGLNLVSQLVSEGKLFISGNKVYGVNSGAVDKVVRTLNQAAPNGVKYEQGKTLKNLTNLEASKSVSGTSTVDVSGIKMPELNSGQMNAIVREDSAIKTLSQVENKVEHEKNVVDLVRQSDALYEGMTGTKPINTGHTTQEILGDAINNGGEVHVLDKNLKRTGETLNLDQEAGEALRDSYRKPGNFSTLDPVSPDDRYTPFGDRLGKVYMDELPENMKNSAESSFKVLTDKESGRQYVEWDSFRHNGEPPPGRILEVVGSDGKSSLIMDPAYTQAYRDTWATITDGYFTVGKVDKFWWENEAASKYLKDYDTLNPKSQFEISKEVMNSVLEKPIDGRGNKIDIGARIEELLDPKHSDKVHPAMRDRLEQLKNDPEISKKLEDLSNEIKSSAAAQPPLNAPAPATTTSSSAAIAGLAGAEEYEKPNQTTSPAETTEDFKPADMFSGAYTPGYEQSPQATQNAVDPYNGSEYLREMGEINKSLETGPTVASTLNYFAGDPKAALETGFQAGATFAFPGSGLLSNAAGLVTGEAISAAFKQMTKETEESPEVKAQKATEALEFYKHTGEWGTWYDNYIKSNWDKDAEAEWVAKKVAEKYEPERLALEQAQKEQRKMLGLPEDGDAEFNRAILEDQKRQARELAAEESEKNSQTFSAIDQHSGAYTPNRENLENQQTDTASNSDQRSWWEKITGKTVEQKNNELAAEEKERLGKIASAEAEVSNDLVSSAPGESPLKGSIPYTAGEKFPGSETTKADATSDSKTATDAEPIGKIGPGGETAMPLPPDPRRNREIKDPLEEAFEENLEKEEDPQGIIKDFEKNLDPNSEGKKFIVDPKTGQIVDEKTGEEYKVLNNGATASNGTDEISSDMGEIVKIKEKDSSSPDNFNEEEEKKFFGSDDPDTRIPVPEDFNFKDINMVPKSDFVDPETTPTPDNPIAEIEDINPISQKNPSFEYYTEPKSAEEAEQSANKIGYLAEKGDYINTLKQNRESLYGKLYSDNSTVMQEALNRFAADNKIDPTNDQKLGEYETDYARRQAEFLKKENEYAREELKQLDQEIAAELKKYQEGVSSLSSEEKDVLKETQGLSGLSAPDTEKSTMESVTEGIRKNVIEQTANFINKNSENPQEMGKQITEYVKEIFNSAENKAPDKTGGDDNQSISKSPEDTPAAEEKRSFSLNDKGELVDQYGNKYEGTGKTTASNEGNGDVVNDASPNSSDKRENNPPSTNQEEENNENNLAPSDLPPITEDQNKLASDNPFDDSSWGNQTKYKEEEWNKLAQNANEPDPLSEELSKFKSNMDSFLENNPDISRDALRNKTLENIEGLKIPEQYKNELSSLVPGSQEEYSDPKALAKEAERFQRGMEEYFDYYKDLPKGALSESANFRELEQLVRESETLTDPQKDAFIEALYRPLDSTEPNSYPGGDNIQGPNNQPETLRNNGIVTDISPLPYSGEEDKKHQRTPDPQGDNVLTPEGNPTNEGNIIQGPFVPDIPKQHDPVTQNWASNPNTNGDTVVNPNDKNFITHGDQLDQDNPFNKIPGIEGDLKSIREDNPNEWNRLVYQENEEGTPASPSWAGSENDQGLWDNPAGAGSKSAYVNDTGDLVIPGGNNTLGKYGSDVFGKDALISKGLDGDVIIPKESFTEDDNFYKINKGNLLIPIGEGAESAMVAKGGFDIPPQKESSQDDWGYLETSSPNIHSKEEAEEINKKTQENPGPGDGPDATPQGDTLNSNANNNSSGEEEEEEDEEETNDNED